LLRGVSLEVDASRKRGGRGVLVGELSIGEELPEAVVLTVENAGLLVTALERRLPCEGIAALSAAQISGGTDATGKVFASLFSAMFSMIAMELLMRSLERNGTATRAASSKAM
jgi:hypothetical protein